MARQEAMAAEGSASPENKAARLPLSGKTGRYNLATTYSRMTCRQTTIGAAAFHFRVRDGNGWFHRAMVTRSGAQGLDFRPAGAALAETLMAGTCPSQDCADESG